LRGSEHLTTAAASKAHPLSFDVNVVVTIAIKNLTLAPGSHRIHVDVISKETAAWRGHH